MSILSINNFTLDHAIHVSVIEVSVVKEQIDVKIKLFEDDFRDALRLQYGKIYSIITEANDTEVQDYFKDHFTIRGTDQKFELDFVAIALVGDSYQVSLQGYIGNQADVHSIEADYLMELFPDQKNIVHYTIGGEKKFGVLNNKKAELVIKPSY